MISDPQGRRTGTASPIADLSGGGAGGSENSDRRRPTIGAAPTGVFLQVCHRYRSHESRTKNPDGAGVRTADSLRDILLAMLVSFPILTGIAGEGAAQTKPPMPRPKPDIWTEQLKRDLTSPLYEPSSIPNFDPLCCDRVRSNTIEKTDLAWPFARPK